VLPDKLGGIFNFTANILAHCGKGFHQTAILTSNTVDLDIPSVEPLAADRQLHVVYSSPPENLYAILRRLRRAVPAGEGILVCNDWLELAMVSAYPTERTVINVTHADAEYYYRLAEIHEPWIDCFIALTDRIYQQLLSRLPSRRDSIFRLPFGVAIPQTSRAPSRGKLRVLYVGRIDRGKGLLDLPEIDRLLVEAGHDVHWTIQGSGPDQERLQRAWSTRSNVEWREARPLVEVLQLYQKNDVFILPSRSEGLPVTLLEAGAAGVVPVVSDLPSGIPDVVEEGVNGFRVTVGDVQGFSERIGTLDDDRELLKTMGREIRQRVSRDFEVTTRARDYHMLFSRFRELKRRPVAKPRLYYGSRLDKRWLPNMLVKFLRSRNAQTPAS
jgi:glycosyltransferase involved in cell wall biosynthesis